MANYFSERDKTSPLDFAISGINFPNVAKIFSWESNRKPPRSQGLITLTICGYSLTICSKTCGLSETIKTFWTSLQRILTK